MGITNDKGRLSKEEIERMVNDAEKFKADDEKQKERISAKNGLESYCFNMKTTLDDEKVKDKISEDDRKAITDKCDEAIKWLDSNQLAEVEEFNAQQKRWRECATPSSPSSTPMLEARPEACPTWEVWEVLEEPLLRELAVPDPPSRRLTNRLRSRRS